ncbi:MAG: SUMF1/EgtB/PvdO family nonheme iron enzyme, partial [Myxococcales bacterium]|nr:SUMF1/EgtB/PvdO family nonheme iron enzyme [Myxococcales bacterium]
GDLVGGVREWCLNAYQRAGPPGEHLRVETPPLDDPELREGRGGAWLTHATLVRPAGRFAGRPEQRFTTVGFRLARSFG